MIRYAGKERDCGSSLFWVSERFSYDGDVVQVVDGQNKNVGELQVPLADFFFESFACPADGLQTVSENFSVRDAEMGDPGFF